MREIKFRAWDKNAYKMAEVTQIIFSKVQHTLVKYRYKTDNGKVKDEASHIDEKGHGTIVLLQYTGLKDKTGKEIYEGDIVKAYNGINEIIGIVKFGKYKQDGSGGEYNSITCTGFYVERIKTIPNAWEIEDDLLYEPDYEKTTSLQSYEYIKVIGNIHDNPELLEV